MTITYLPNELTKEDRDFYEKINPGFKATGDCLKIEYDSGEAITHIIFKGKFTPYRFVRDCGDHFIHACFSYYERIDKNTLEIKKYVEDC